MDTSHVSASLAEVISTEMRTAGHTVKSMAEAAGIPRVTLHRRLLTGSFQVSEVAAIADILGTSPSSLMERAEHAAAA